MNEEQLKEMNSNSKQVAANSERVAAALEVMTRNFNEVSSFLLRFMAQLQQQQKTKPTATTAIDEFLNAEPSPLNEPTKAPK